MMKNVLLIGSEGSMGQRYQSILNLLGIKYSSYDTAMHNHECIYDFKQFDGIILASPTSTHYSWIDALRFTDRPILCEKPISTSISEIDEISSWKMNISMMFQYRYIAFSSQYSINFNWDGIGKKSSYNYFRTGKDGLLWDCMQIIILHQGKMEDLELSNSAPIWKCTLNNEEIRFNLMDYAYVRAVEDWLWGVKTETEDNFILRAHKKVIEYKAYYDKSSDRNSSAINQ